MTRNEGGYVVHSTASVYSGGSAAPSPADTQADQLHDLQEALNDKELELMELRVKHSQLQSTSSEAQGNWEAALQSKDRAIRQLEDALTSKERALAAMAKRERDWQASHSKTASEAREHEHNMQFLRAQVADANNTMASLKAQLESGAPAVNDSGDFAILAAQGPRRSTARPGARQLGAEFQGMLLPDNLSLPAMTMSQPPPEEVLRQFATGSAHAQQLQAQGAVPPSAQRQLSLPQHAELPAQAQLQHNGSFPTWTSLSQQAYLPAAAAAGPTGSSVQSAPDQQGSLRSANFVSGLNQQLPGEAHDRHSSMQPGQPMIESGQAQQAPGQQIASEAQHRHSSMQAGQQAGIHGQAAATAGGSGSDAVPQAQDRQSALGWHASGPQHQGGPQQALPPATYDPSRDPRLVPSQQSRAAQALPPPAAMPGHPLAPQVPQQQAQQQQPPPPPPQQQQPSAWQLQQQPSSWQQNGQQTYSAAPSQPHSPTYAQTAAWQHSHPETVLTTQPSAVPQACHPQQPLLYVNCNSPGRQDAGDAANTQEIVATLERTRKLLAAFTNRSSGGQKRIEKRLAALVEEQGRITERLQQQHEEVQSPSKHTVVHHPAQRESDSTAQGDQVSIPRDLLHQALEATTAKAEGLSEQVCST